MATFYGVHDIPTFDVLFVWWPPVENVTARARGSRLLLAYHPIQHRSGAERDADVAVHEVAHWISAHRLPAEKRALTTRWM